MWAGECVGATGSMGALCGMTERGRTSSRISGDSGRSLEGKGVTVVETCYSPNMHEPL